jgi:hypothetical protein
MRPFFLCVAAAFLGLGTIAFAADYSGTVVGPDGKPVKGAAVYLFQSNGAAQGVAKIDAPTTRADDKGQFHFSQVTSGATQMLATADGFGAGVSNVQGEQATKIHLRPRTDLILTFIGPDNKPAVGVPISLQSMSYSQVVGVTTNLSIPPGFNSPISATTDSKGVCTIGGLPQGSTVDMAVTDEHFAALSYQDEQMLAFQPQTRADPIHLVAACTIAGHMTYADSGKPAAGITVDGQPIDFALVSAVTAADGSYVLKQLRPSRYTILLHPDEKLEKNFTAKAVENVNLGASPAATGIDLSLISGVTLSGTVVAADDGSAIAGVPVAINGPAHPRETTPTTVQTNANGAFTLRVVPGEQLVYIASDTPADGFARPSPDSKTVVAQQGTTQSVQFRLPRVLMAPLVGKVVDPDGNPVAGANVYLSSEDLPMMQRMSVSSKADGTFQTPPVPRTARIQLRARAGDLATSKALIVSRNSPGPVTLQLEKGALASISGRVIDPQGQPISGAQIELVIRSGRSSNWQDSGLSDSQGNFKIDSLWADGIYYVDVSRNGYGEAETSELRPAAGQILAARDLTLFKRDSTVAGVLLDAESKPVAGQRIYINGPKTGYNDLTTDSNGKFSCSVVSADRITIFYNYAPQRGYSRLSARSGDQNIILHTAPPRAAPPRAAPLAVAPSGTPTEPSPSPAAPLNIDPAALVTWRAWEFSAILVVIGGAITIIANAIASLKARKHA